MKNPARTWNAVMVGEDTPCWSGTRRRRRAETPTALIGAVVVVLEDLRPALPTRRGLQIQRYGDVRLITPQPSAMSTPTETFTPAAMVRMDSPRRRRSRIAARLSSSATGRRPPTLPCLRAVSRPFLVLRDDVAAAVPGQVEDEGAFGVLAGADALRYLDADALLEQVVEDDQSFQEVAAEPVEFLDGQHVALADVGQRGEQVGPVLGGELAAGFLLDDLQADRIEGVILPLGPAARRC